MLSWLLIVTAACPTASGALEASSCAPIFGGPKERSADATERSASRLSLQPGGACLDIVYSHGAFAEPAPIAFSGAHLLATKTAPGCAPFALVSLSKALAGAAGCRPGVYRVGVDDKLGFKNAIAGIFDDGLLLVRAHALRVLMSGTLVPPPFRLIWQSTWSLPHRSTTASSPPVFGFRR